MQTVIKVRSCQVILYTLQHVCSPLKTPKHPFKYLTNQMKMDESQKYLYTREIILFVTSFLNEAHCFYVNYEMKYSFNCKCMEGGTTKNTI